jgi:hypothetical protein
LEEGEKRKRKKGRKMRGGERGKKRRRGGGRERDIGHGGMCVNRGWSRKSDSYGGKKTWLVRTEWEVGE